MSINLSTKNNNTNSQKKKFFLIFFFKKILIRISTEVSSRNKNIEDFEFSQMYKKKMDELLSPKNNFPKN